MSLWNRLRNAYRIFRSQHSTQLMDLSMLIPEDGGTASARVNQYTVLTYAPIWYSVCKMAGHIGQVPKKVKRTIDGKVEEIPRARSNLNDLLNFRCNDFMTSMDAFETVQKDAVVSGNGRLGILRENGKPMGLIPIHPESAWCFISYPDTDSRNFTVSERNPFRPLYDAQRKWHHVTSAKGDQFILPDSDVIHIKGLQHDGLVGMEMWWQARQSIAPGLAAEDYVNQTLNNSGIPGIILQAPAGVLTNDDKAKEFLDTFRRHHSGPQNAGNTALLRYGVTAEQLSQTSRDGQLMEHREFTRDEAFMWTGDMLFYQGGSAYSNQQERDEAYKTHTLSRWATKYEKELEAKLLTPGQIINGWCVDFELDAILRGSLKSRLESYEIARRIGYLSQEEIRERDGLPAPDPNENFDNPNTSSPDDGPESPTEPQDAPQDDDDAPVEARGYTGHFERDGWIYDQHAAGLLTLDQIIDQMPEQNSEWTLIATKPGLRGASNRYADWCGLPRVNRHKFNGQPVS